jgi:hypothetical protein
MVCAAGCTSTKALGVDVGVKVLVGVNVFVGVGVFVRVGVIVGVFVGVAVGQPSGGQGVGVGVSVGVFVIVAVAVGDGGSPRVDVNVPDDEPAIHVPLALLPSLAATPLFDVAIPPVWPADVSSPVVRSMVPEPEVERLPHMPVQLKSAPLWVIVWVHVPEMSPVKMIVQ